MWNTAPAILGPDQKLLVAHRAQGCDVHDDNRRSASDTLAA
jgi:hypothetical protein